MGPARRLAIVLLLLGSACDTAGPEPTVEASSVPPTVAPTPSEIPSFVRPTPKPSPTFVVYEVHAGDSLSSIAREFGTTARSIAYWNRDVYPSLDPDSAAYDPDSIKIGWMLRLIPTAVVDEDDLPEPMPSATPTPTATPSMSQPPESATPEQT